MVDQIPASPSGPGLDVLRLVAKRLGASDDEVAKLNSAEGATFLIDFLRQNHDPVVKPADGANPGEKPVPTLNKASGTPPGQLPGAPTENTTPVPFLFSMNPKCIKNSARWNLAEDGSGMIPNLLFRFNEDGDAEVI